ncbi:NIPSNAP family protein [Chloroflexota bacterium]
MIYEHRTYTILPGKMAEFVEAFGKSIAPIFPRYGAKLIGAWRPSIGQNNEFFYIVGFEDLSQQQAFWQKFREDPDVVEYRKSGVRVAYLTNKIMVPTTYSPLQ